MAGRNDGCRGRSREQGARYLSPAPLYGAESLFSQGWRAQRGTARAALANTEMRVHRPSAPLPVLSSPADGELADLLRQQNALLTEILGVLNAQLSLSLERRDP